MELNPTLLEGRPRDLVAEFAEHQGLERADALVELKKAGQRWKASEKALRAELAAPSDPQAASSTAVDGATESTESTTREQTEQTETPAGTSDSDLAMWAEWLGGVLSCCFQREGH